MIKSQFFASAPMTNDPLEESAESELSVDPVQSEFIAFKSGEMVICGACTRANPPNRHACLYCGKDLDVTAEFAELIKPALRKLESWEKGFNVIYRPPATPLDSTIFAKAADQL